MASKQSLSAPETNYIESKINWLKEVVCNLGGKNVEALKNLPDKVIKEMDLFIRRNSLAIVNSKKGNLSLHCCCSNCLKGHLISNRRQLEFNEQTEKLLKRILPCETGHAGFYLDGSVLKKV